MKYNILDLPELYRDNQYKVSYKLVLLRAIKHYFENNGGKLVEELLTDLQTSIRTKEGYYEPHFVELYHFHNERNQAGLLLVDRSKGCFPLVFYPQDENPEHKNRIKAFQTILSRLLNNNRIFGYDKILKDSLTWDHSIVETLKNTFAGEEKSS